MALPALPHYAAHSEVRLHGGRPADKPSAPAHPISAKQTRSPLSQPPRTGVSYPAREPGFSALARGTPHSAPGAFEGLPARYWAVMKFIHDEGELTWLNNNPENRLPLGFAGRARRNARPAFFPAPAPRFSLRPCARRIPISAKQTRAARFSQHAISATCPPKEETNFHREGRARPGSPLRVLEVSFPFHDIHRAI